MNFHISVALGMMTSLLATFFLFALAFTRSAGELRMAVPAVYAGLFFACACVVWLSPKRFLPGVFAALWLPVLMLFYLGSQSPEFFLHAAVLVSVVFTMCWRFSKSMAGKAGAVRRQKDWE